MAPHSSTLAWKIPWTEEPGRLQSMRSHRVGHDWSDLAAANFLISIPVGLILSRASLVAQMVKNLPVMWETLLQSLGQENPWRREWKPTPVLLPGESHGQWSLAGYSPWCWNESDNWAANNIIKCKLIPLNFFNFILGQNGGKEDLLWVPEIWGRYFFPFWEEK